MPSRIGRITGALRTTRLRGANRRAWIYPTIAALVLLGVGVWANLRMERFLRGELVSVLETTRDANVNALSLWISDQKAVVTVAAADARLRGYVQQLAGLDADREQLLASPARTALEQHLAPTMKAHRYAGFEIVDNDGRFLAASDSRTLGQRMRLLHLLDRISAGETIVGPPRIVEGKGAIMFVAAPIRDDAGRVIAALGLRPDPERFTEILTVGRIGESGETYAINEAGTMISRSRFHADLRRAGILEEGQDSVFNVAIRDPGGNLLDGHKPDKPVGARAFTVAASGAVIEKRAGHDADGYRDYRGVRVVGAWTWLDEYDCGVITEVDHDEGYATLTILRTAFRILMGLLVVAAIAGFVLSRSVYGLRRKVSEAMQLGQYTLGKKIGEGGMGEVFEAHHAMLRRPTALKLLRAEDASTERIGRFEREVQLCSQLTNPHTIAIYDYGRAADGTFYYAMEYLKGLSLDRLVLQEDGLPPARVIHLLKQACGSLAEAHDAGLVHRDVKPSNMMVCSQGGIPDFVKVLDFGLVREMSAEASELTQMGTIVGTPLYLAPEAIQGREVDLRVDIYALGAVGYYMLCGGHMFDAESVLDVINMQLTQTPELPSQRLGRPVPARLEQIIMRCLNKEPDDRPASAIDLLHDLEAVDDAGTWTRADAQKWWAGLVQETLS